MYKNRKGYFYTLLLYNKKYIFHIGKSTKNVKAVLCNFKKHKTAFRVPISLAAQLVTNFVSFGETIKKNLSSPLGSQILIYLTNAR